MIQARLLVAFVALTPTAGLTQTSWRRLAQLGPRAFVQMAYDPVTRLSLLFGGCSPFSVPDAELWGWSGTTWTQLDSGSGPSPRFDPAVVYDVARGRLVLFGGATSSSLLGDTWEWDGTRWASLGSSGGPSARTNHCMAYDAIGQRTILFGGSDNTTVPQNDTWAWDGTSWTQLLPATSPGPRWGASLVFDAVTGRLQLFGGYPTSSLTTPSSETWEFDVTTWRRVATLGPGRVFHAAFFDAVSQQPVVFAGWDGNAARDDTWAWNGAAWQARVGSPGPAPRTGAGIAYDTVRRRAVLFGGLSAGSHSPAETWEWNGSRWLLVRADSDIGRAGLAMAFDGVGPLAFGGNGNSGDRDDTLRWSGTAWLPLAPANRPPARSLHAMAFDRGRGNVVLFGGFDQQQTLGDTWLWDGNDWRPHTAQPQPPPRMEHALAYDRRRQRVVLFGGTQVADTWEFGGAGWTQRSPAHSPPPRFRTAMAFDPVRDIVLLYGGMNFQLQTLSDTWQWDGNDWTQLQPSSSPGPRPVYALAEDDARARIVLPRSSLFDPFTWEWNGTTWLPRNATHPYEIGYGLAYDPRSEEVVRFGGGGGLGNRLDETWLYSTSVPAAFTTHYTSCPSSGAPRLDGTRPWIGERFTVQVTGLPPGSAAHLILGTSATTLFGTIPLPLDLTPLGLTACWLYTDIAISAPMATSAGTAVWSTVLCTCPSLLGSVIFCQALAADPPANPAGLILTNAAVARLGVK